MVLQFGASLTDDTRSINYNHNMFTIQATGGHDSNILLKLFSFSTPVLIRHMLELNTVVFRHWCLLHVPLLNDKPTGHEPEVITI